MITGQEALQLEGELTRAMRDVLARWSESGGSHGQARIRSAGGIPKFSYAWPTGLVEYSPATGFEVEWQGALQKIVVATEVGGREAFREVRRREIAFVPAGGGLYPVREWTGTPEGPHALASLVVRPDAPRKAARVQHMPVIREIPHLADAEIVRKDELFPSVRYGDTLYVVSRVDDFTNRVGTSTEELSDDKELGLVLSHSLWVAELRGRLRS